MLSSQFTKDYELCRNCGGIKKIQNHLHKRVVSAYSYSPRRAPRNVKSQRSEP